MPQAPPSLPLLLRLSLFPFPFSCLLSITFLEGSLWAGCEPSQALLRGHSPAWLREPQGPLGFWGPLVVTTTAPPPACPAQVAQLESMGPTSVLGMSSGKGHPEFICVCLDVLEQVEELNE